jgi:hypothetical protein
VGAKPEVHYRSPPQVVDLSAEFIRITHGCTMCVLNHGRHAAHCSGRASGDEILAARITRVHEVHMTIHNAG